LIDVIQGWWDDYGTVQRYQLTGPAPEQEIIKQSVFPTRGTAAVKGWLIFLSSLQPICRPK
jgi:hypothetical protein